MRKELKNLNGYNMLSAYQIELFKIDEGAKIDVDKKLYDLALSAIIKKSGVKKKDLEYIGFSDLSWSKAGGKLLQFNVTDKNHELFKSTLSYNTGTNK